MRSRLFILVSSLCAGLAASSALASPRQSAPAKPRLNASRPAATVSFRETIEPFLKANCTTCHKADAPASGFNIESVEGMFKGGTKFGARVIVPGKPQESVLIAYLHGTKQPRMPMNRPAIPEPQIKLLEAWIAGGAKVDTAKLGWPYVAPTRHKIPAVKNSAWIKNPIDAFVLAKLEAKGLKPSPPASRTTLMRRVYADLIGLPPTLQEVNAFLKDKSPNAYEKLVDRLLADPRYGERWARHWLDLVRYAETHGFESDGARPRAWRYRDYVIRAFNSDKPYDRFLKEQIAGDELFPDDSDAIIATGFARLGSWDELSTDHPQRWQDYLNDVTDTTASVMLGLTVGCARCHNHKYDKISQADYYRMQAFFTPTRWTEAKLPSDSIDPPAFREQIVQADAKLEKLRKQQQELLQKYRTLALDEKRKSARTGTKVEVSEDEVRQKIEKNEADNRRREELENEINRIDREINPLRPLAEVISDEGKIAPKTFLLKRGDLHSPGPEVQPGFVASLVGGVEKPAVISPTTGNTTGRRSALANWIASTHNPMTARVMVNRLWQHHFGQGIVGTPSDFGLNGDRPSHPELLDWLAGVFSGQWAVDGGQKKETHAIAQRSEESKHWSLKKMHRLMLLSNTYRQSTDVNPAGEKADPTNHLLWRMNRIRLEGETLRDSILALSGRLNSKMGGPGIYPKVSAEVLSTGSTHKWGSSPEEEGRRRTIYVFQRRSLALPLVDVFDGADMANTCPRRSRTTIAPQALALFNGDFSREEARHFAGRVQKEAGVEREKQIDWAYRIALQRPPSAAQKKVAMTFLTQQTALHREAGPKKKEESEARLAALADLCHVLMNTNEFLYLD